MYEFNIIPKLIVNIGHDKLGNLNDRIGFISTRNH